MRCSTIGSESSEARLTPASSSMSLRSRRRTTERESTPIALGRGGPSTLVGEASLDDPEPMKNLRVHRILLATDGSEPAQAAVSLAANFARASNASVEVVHVWNLEIRRRHGVWDLETRSEATELVESTVDQLCGLDVDAHGDI